MVEAYLLAIVSTMHLEKPCSVEKWDDVAVLPARQWHRSQTAYGCLEAAKTTRCLEYGYFECASLLGNDAVS